MIGCHDISYPLPFIIFIPGLGVPEDLQNFFFPYSKAIFEADINFMIGHIFSECMYYIWIKEMFPYRTLSIHGSRISFIFICIYLEFF